MARALSIDPGSARGRTSSRCLTKAFSPPGATIESPGARPRCPRGCRERSLPRPVQRGRLAPKGGASAGCILGVCVDGADRAEAVDREVVEVRVEPGDLFDLGADSIQLTSID